MAVKTKAEIMELVKSKIGEDTSDETIALLEDLSDTLDTTNDSVNWKQKYEDNDKEWRAKYSSRFFEGGNEPKPEPEPEPEDNTDVTIDELFTEKE